jgi:hypothetical protein
MRKTIFAASTFLVCLTAIGATAQEYCEDVVAAEWLKKGREMKLLRDYRYVDPAGHEWIANGGRTVNGASIPRFLWSFTGGPYEGLYRDASVVHDVECKDEKQSWRAVHRMFYQHMICSGVRPALAKGMYWAVYNCGPRWGDDVGNRLFPCGNDKEMRDALAAVECATQNCPSSRIDLADSGPAVLVKLENLTPAALRDQPKLAGLDMRQGVSPQNDPHNRADQRFAMERRRDELSGLTALVGSRLSRVVLPLGLVAIAIGIVFWLVRKKRT